jgi:ribosomal protein S21
MSRAKHQNHELTIFVRNSNDPDNYERCIKILSREIQKAGIMKEYKRHRYFVTNGEKRYEAERISAQRRRRAEAKKNKTKSKRL